VEVVLELDDHSGTHLCSGYRQERAPDFEAEVRAPHCGSKPQPNLSIVAEGIAVLEKQQQRQKL
jgi:hypothetical protein